MIEFSENIIPLLPSNRQVSKLEKRTVYPKRSGDPKVVADWTTHTSSMLGVYQFMLVPSKLQYKLSPFHN